MASSRVVLAAFVVALGPLVAAAHVTPLAATPSGQAPAVKVIELKAGSHGTTNKTILTALRRATRKPAICRNNMLKCLPGILSKSDHLQVTRFINYINVQGIAIIEMPAFIAFNFMKG